MNHDQVNEYLDSPAEYVSVRPVTAPVPGRARLAVSGELEGSTTPVLADSLAAVLSGPAPEAIELDLSGVTFVDSSGIHCLLECRERALDHGTRLLLVDPAPSVSRILEITDLLTVFGLPPVTVPPARQPRQAHA